MGCGIGRDWSFRETNSACLRTLITHATEIQLSDSRVKDGVSEF